MKMMKMMKNTEFEFFILCNLEYRPKTPEIMTNPSLSKHFYLIRHSITLVLETENLSISPKFYVLLSFVHL